MSARRELALGVLILAGCARASNEARTVEPSGADPAVSPETSTVGASAEAPTVVVTDRTAFLVGSAYADDVDPPRFHRLERLFADLKRRRPGAPDAGFTVDDPPALVQASAKATPLAVFSALTTCAFAGFPRVVLRSEDGPEVDGEILVPGKITEGGWEELNGRPIGVSLHAHVSPDGIDVAWRDVPCSEMPLAGHTTLGALAGWLDLKCPSSEPCFDLANVRFDPRVPLRDIVRALSTLERWGRKPLFYLPFVMPEDEAPRPSCRTGS